MPCLISPNSNIYGSWAHCDLSQLYKICSCCGSVLVTEIYNTRRRIICLQLILHFIRYKQKCILFILTVKPLGIDKRIKKFLPFSFKELFLATTHRRGYKLDRKKDRDTSNLVLGLMCTRILTRSVASLVLCGSHSLMCANMMPQN